jgi:hypothetical protein
MQQSAPTTLSLLRMHRCRIRLTRSVIVEGEKRVDGRNDRRGESRWAGQAEAGKVLGWRCCFELQSAAARQLESRARAGLLAGRHGHGRPWPWDRRSLPAWRRQEAGRSRQAQAADGDSALPPLGDIPNAPQQGRYNATPRLPTCSPVPMSAWAVGTRKKARSGRRNYREHAHPGPSKSCSSMVAAWSSLDIMVEY